MIVLDIVKVFLPATVAFLLGIGLTPLLTHYLYKYKLWKHRGGKIGLDGKATTEFNKLHKEREVGTPRMGGIIIWGSTAITIIGIWILANVFQIPTLEKLDFLSRSQTWIPLFTLLAGALVGLIDDLLEIFSSRKGKSGGLPLTKRLLIVTVIALFVAWWFYTKLDVVTLGIPFAGELFLGWLFIPFFVSVVLALYSGGVIDGIDGLSGGVFASMFAAYAGVAFYQQQIDLAAFSAMMTGAILAFLWFNIPPARFYMSETGSMGLTITLAVVAFMTDALGGGHGVLALPLIALPLMATTASNILQVTSKKFRGKKLFRVAPLHHHFEAIGWPAYKVTMRYWIIGIVCALLGMIFALIG